MLSRTLFSTSILLFLILLGSAPAVAQSSVSERLVFSAFKDGQWDIYSIAADGNDLRALTSDVYEDRDPVYSPDGRQLAYASRRDGNWDIYLLDLASGDETRLTTQPHYDAAPAWHPDGSRLAFESMQGGDLDVWILNELRVDAVTNLTADWLSGEFAPTWSADGTRLLFSSWQGGTIDVWTMDATGQERRRLTSMDGAERSPRWLASSDTLFYLGARLGDQDIFALAASAEEPVQQTWLGSVNAYTFSPDQAGMAGILRTHFGYRLLRLDAGTVVPTVLLETAQMQGGLDWHATPLNFGMPVPDLITTDDRALYEEIVRPSSSPYGEPHDLYRLNDVQTGSPWLADPVDDSFRALKQVVEQTVGYDYLGTLSDMLRPLDYYSDDSLYTSWHKSGRAFDTLFDLPTGAMLIAREDIGNEVYWRIYLRCGDQSGGCGRPLTANPWDYSYRARVEIAPGQGGLEGPNLNGYYLDFTQLAELYGWERISSYDDDDFSWRWYFTAFEYWHYQKTYRNQHGHADWYRAMKEVYPPQEVETHFNWERMRNLDEDPYLIVLKGVPHPPQVQLWWQGLWPQ